LYGCDSGERGNFTTSASHEYSQSCSPDPGPAPARCGNGPVRTGPLSLWCGGTGPGRAKP
jgi:hypothetical protein